MDQLEELFKAGDQKPKLVFLGSCASQKHGNALTKAGVPHVVAVDVQNDIAGASRIQHSRRMSLVLKVKYALVRNSLCVFLNEGHANRGIVCGAVYVFRAVAGAMF